MGKINIAELVAMLDAGIPQKDCAVHFNTSAPAVSQAVTKLKQNAAAAERPEVLDKLTDKELKFSIEVAGGASQTHAALVAYDVTSRESAKSLGCTLMKNPDIAEAVVAIMESEGLSRRYLVKRLRSHVDAADPQASLRAVDMGMKIHSMYPAEKQVRVNLNADVCPVDLSNYGALPTVR